MIISHVLVIEDSYLFAQYLSDIAMMAGAQSVAVVSNQRDAIAAARKHQPDLILSDVNLGNGNGPAAVNTIVANQGHMPVIFVTGHRLEHAACPKGSMILNKPVAPDALLAAISDALFQKGLTNGHVGATWY